MILSKLPLALGPAIVNSIVQACTWSSKLLVYLGIWQSIPLLDLHDILSFDVEFGKILQELQVLVSRKQYLESMGSDNQGAIVDLCFRGAPIEDLCLDFSLPGYPDYILKPGEENVICIPLQNLDGFFPSSAYLCLQRCS